MPTATRAGSAVPQARARPKRLTLPRLIANIFLVGAIILLIFYGGGGWYYSTQIYENTFVLSQPTGIEYTVRVTDSADGVVTLVGVEAGTIVNGPGIRGVEWADGYGRVDQILAQEFVEGGAELQLEVVRAYEPAIGDLRGGVDVAMENYAYPSDPATAFGIPYETIAYSSDLGQIPSWYIRGTQPTWMIFVHDKGAPLRESLRLLPVAVDRGYHVLVINYRNDADSPRDPTATYQYGTTEWADLDAAAFHARENGADELVVVGYGMGGAIVTSFLTQSPLSEQASAAILDSPVLDLGATVDHQMGSTVLPIPLVDIEVPGTLSSIARWMASIRYEISWEDYNWVDDSVKLETPMLIFHGREDATVPLSTSRSLWQKRPNLIKLVETPAGNLLSWNMDPNVYEAEVTAFLDLYVS